MTKVEFQVKVLGVLPSYVVAVVGSARTLGHWKPSRALKLASVGEDNWKLCVDFEADENVFNMEYKYLAVGPRGSTEIWLPGKNLRIKPPEIIHATDDAWIIASPNNDEDMNSTRSQASSTTPATPPPPAPKETTMLTPTTIQNDDEDWYQDSIFYLIYCLGTPGHGGGGFFGDCPDVNDQVSPPTPRLLRLRLWYDHLCELGVNAIYLTPIFESGTHGYDTYDYFRIDRRLGDLDDFKVLLSELHARKIRVVLDGVFNHTGRGHFAFEDIRSRGHAWRDSPYVNWYFLKDGRSSHGDPFRYETWSGHEILPKLNLANPEVRNHIFDVARFWLELGIDGWRLDCASDIAPEFWREFREQCCAVRKNVVLIGEIIHGDYNKWVDDKELLTSATNYQIYKPIWSSLNDKNFYELRHNMEREVSMYAAKVFMTFIGNHDVNRIASVLGGNKSKVLLAHALLFTIRGVPCLYYGDECFMQGEKEHGGDAKLREGMYLPSDSRWDRTLFNAIKRLSKCRHSLASLRRGTVRVLWNSNMAIVIARELSAETTLIAINCDETPCDARASGLLHSFVEEVPIMNDTLPLDAQTLKVNQGGSVCVTLDANSVRIFCIT